MRFTAVNMMNTQDKKGYGFDHPVGEAPSTPLVKPGGEFEIF
jgi:hypothetical protein